MQCLLRSHLNVLVAGVLFATCVLVAPLSMGHEIEHAHHHDAETHATSFCAWLCAAGASVDVRDHSGVESLLGGERIRVIRPLNARCHSILQLSPRGPPIYGLPPLVDCNN